MTASVLALLAAGVALVALSALRARAPDQPIPDLDGYFAAWRTLHAGYDPRDSGWARGWLTVAWWVARPVARAGVPPTLVTLWGVWVAVGVLVAGVAGGRWALLGAGAVVATALADTLDGAVAVLTGRASRWGHVLDSAADRVSDVLLLLALWALGGVGWVVAAAGGLLGLLEYIRARAGTAGLTEIGIVTVGERPTRLVLVAVACAGAGAFIGHSGLVATAGAAAVAVVSGVGVVQFGVVAHRRLSAPPG